MEMDNKQIIFLDVLSYFLHMQINQKHDEIYDELQFTFACGALA